MAGRDEACVEGGTDDLDVALASLRRRRRALEAALDLADRALAEPGRLAWPVTAPAQVNAPAEDDPWAALRRRPLFARAAGRQELHLRRGQGAPLRLLYVQPGTAFGGAERQAATLIPRLGRLGIDVVPLVGPGRAVCRWLDAEEVRGTIFSREFPAARGPLRALRCARRVREQVRSILRAGSVDLVLASGPLAWLAITPEAHRAGVPVVWRAGAPGLGAAARAVLWAWSRLRAPALLLSVAQAVHQTLAPLVPADQAAVIPNGVDLAAFRPGRGDPRAYRPGGAAVVIGLAGRLPAPDELLAVVARLRRAHPQAAFLVAGDGPGRAACEEAARRAGLGQAVRFLGFVPEMPSFYSSCDIVMHTAPDQGCPNVLLEAMAMGRPVVAARAAGVAQVIRDGRDGLPYHAGGAEQAAALLARVIEQPGLRARLAAAGRVRVQQRHDADEIAGRVAELLRAVPRRMLAPPTPVPRLVEAALPA